MHTWKNSPITRRADGSYIISYAGFPEYHVPNLGEWKNLWLEINTYAQDHPEKITQELPPTPPTEKELRIRELNIEMSNLQNYLSSTDWYVVRYADSGKGIPEDIKTKRQEAREQISKIVEEINNL